VNRLCATDGTFYANLFLPVADVGRTPITICPMPKYVYSFKAAVGTFWIRQERDKSWSLSIGDEGIIEVLGYYDSAFDAADSVHMQCTGWEEWDGRSDNDAPATLLAWTKTVVR